MGDRRRALDGKRYPISPVIGEFADAYSRRGIRPDSNARLPAAVPLQEAPTGAR